MSIINDGGPAFPVPPERVNHVGGDNHWSYAAPGMSLRDYFAAHERISADDQAWELCEALAGPRPTCEYKANPLAWLDWTLKWQSALRYRAADAKQLQLPQLQTK